MAFPDATATKQLDDWCKTYCPELPRKVSAIVAEWYTADESHRLRFATYLILNAVRQSVAPADTPDLPPINPPIDPPHEPVQ